jgi:uncharacterized protein GlcG (DUF336 family)
VIQHSRRMTSIAASLALLLSACGGGGSSRKGASGGGGGGGGPTHLYKFPGPESLSIDDVKKVLSQATAEAQARSLPAVIAVTDRVGNVLAVYDMTGANPNAKFPDAAAGALSDVDFEGVSVPAELAAIAKAITGAYLSSGGHAFTTRTASMIVQQNFPPGPDAKGLESGPLFGVQFSSLSCSDLISHFDPNGSKDANAFIGPKDSPLGLSADPGGFPLYKNGVVVGGIGVMADGDYNLDPDVFDVDMSDEEAMALAGTIGFDAPVTIRADRISIDGTTLRYSDMTPAALKSNPAGAPPFDTIPPGVGKVTAVNGFFGGAINAGHVYGTESSGIRPATAAEFNNIDAFILTNGSGANRYPARAGTDGAEVSSPLTQAEVTALLEEAFKIMSKTRAQIRQPLDSRAQVTIAVVDTRGEALGLVRAPDGALFGIDVALQKARTASFFSSPYAAADLSADIQDGLPRADKKPPGEVPPYVTASQSFLNDPHAFTGDYAFSVRGLGNIARPFFPDGQNGTKNGSLSLPINVWSPFATGLQSALIVGPPLKPNQCTSLGGSSGPDRLKNGLQIFAGGVPIYRGNTLIGGIGISGDGIDQDDMIGFLGIYNAGKRTGTIAEAPVGIRDDEIVVHTDAGNTRLRYVNCPFAPFIDDPAQNVCEGI